MTKQSLVKVEKLFTNSTYYVITGAANNGSGLIRLTITNPGTIAYSTGDRIYVFGVLGTVEANGFWIVTVINNTTIDLQGSTFTNAYTSGGRTQSAYSWSKESWANYIRLVIVGGGGSGGSGARTASATGSGGGSGGGGAEVSDNTLPASNFNNTEYYSIAAEVAGPTATGTAGINGNISSFTVGNTTFISYGGGAGSGGGFSNAGGGGAGLLGSASGATGGLFGGVSGATGGTVNSTNISGAGAAGGGGTINSSGVSGGFSPFGAGGGGSGGGKNTATPNVYFDGGAGGASRDVSGSAGGTNAGTVNGTAGVAGTGARPGSGGGGGAAHATQAGNGGAGGTPGGGGGGGGSSITTTGNFGNGGNGARGEIWVFQFENDPSGGTTGYGMIIG